MSITKSLRELIAAFGGSAAAVPNRIDKLIGKLADVVEDGGSGGGGEGESNVVRIPFTLTADPDTGTITGTTDAVIADAAAAMAAGKILIADAMLDAGGYGTQHLCAVMIGTTGVSGVGVAFKACASMLSDDGTELNLYGLAWDSSGVTVHGGKAAVSP